MTKIIQPTYTRNLPSSGKAVKFRPFTVKEEKSLLLALQEGDITTLATAIGNLIEACTDGSVNPQEVPYYDVEYMFLQIRSKSIGEVIDMIGRCDCDENVKTEFSVDISNTEVVPKPVGNVMIKIPDTPYTIEFRHPSLFDFVKSVESKGTDGEEIVANCIVKIFTETEVLTWSKEETLEFVGSMSTKQQKDIAAFLKDMPIVKLPATYKCRKCSKEHTNVLSGFENFFV
jgi:hypothetical protein